MNITDKITIAYLGLGVLTLVTQYYLYNKRYGQFPQYPTRYMQVADILFAIFVWPVDIVVTYLMLKR